MTAIIKAFSVRASSPVQSSKKERGTSPTNPYEIVKETFGARKRRMERQCIEDLQEYCEQSNIEISESLLFRFACFHGFDLKKAQEAIGKSQQNEKYLNLKMDSGLRQFFNRKILLPLPGLVKTKAGHAMQAIYFRPCRFLAAEPSHHEYVVEALQYVLNDLSRLQEQSRTGVAIIINLANHTNKNFHKPTVAKFLGSTEGKLVPTKVNLLIFVDAPPIFKPLMGFCKKAFSMNFAKKVLSVKSHKLSSLFLPGYEDYLPSELPGGWQDFRASEVWSLEASPWIPYFLGASFTVKFERVRA